MTTKSPTGVTKAPTVYQYLIPADQLPWGAWFSLSLIIVGAALLARNMMPADFVFLGINALLTLTQIITVNEAVAGFSQTGMLTVGVLMVASHGVSQTGGLGYYATKVLGTPRYAGSALVRALSLGGLISSFVNDTPTFLLLLPVLQSWSVKLGMDIRTLVLPMSFTVLLGGTNTLIGTSTNLAVSGEFAKYYPKITMEFFGITRVGIPVFFWGLSYLFIFAEALLPSKLKKTPAMDLHDAENQMDSMLLRATVSSQSIAIGKTIEEAGLRGLRVLYLFSVRRGEKVFHAVNPTFILEEGDELSFSGSPDSFAQVCNDAGLTPQSSDQIQDQSSLVQGHVVTVIVRDGASIVGLTPKEAQFRSRFGASILGIQRAGHKIDAEIGQVKFQVGDVLAILTNDSFDLYSETVSRDLRAVDLKLSNSAGDGYLIGAVVSSSSKIAFGEKLGGKSVEEAKLRGLSDAFLVAIIRADTREIIRNPDPTTIINTGDTLWFAGNGLGVIQTVRRIPGLELTSETQANKLNLTYQVERKLVEIVIAPRSFLIGSTVREARFRTRFGAAVVAIRRGTGSNEELVGTNLADVVLKVGDVLLLDASPDFLKQYGADPNFLVVNAVVESSPVQFRLFFISLGLFISIFIIFVATNTAVSLIPLGLVICGIMVYLGVLTPAQARAAVNWEVLYTIAAAAGLSTALTKTGLARAIGGAFVQLSISTGGGTTGVIAALYMATMLVSLLVANNAAALIMFSIGREVEKAYPGLDPLTMAYTIMLAASASFLIPYGYQTNIMALAMGPYTTVEAVKFGFPLQMLLIPVSVLALADLNGNWYVHVAVAVVVFLLAVVFKLFIRKGRANINLSLESKFFLKDSSGDKVSSASVVKPVAGSAESSSVKGDGDVPNTMSLL